MVESTQDSYKLQFIKYDVTRGHAEYFIKVMAPGGITFHIKDRYSSMRTFQSMIKKKFNLKTFNGFPNFPGKTIFSKTSEEFLTQRMNQMQNFFNNFFTHPQILQEHGSLCIYFKEKSADKQSKQKIEELVEYLDKKPATPQKQQQQKPLMMVGQEAPKIQIGGGNHHQGQDGLHKDNMIVQTANTHFDWKNFEIECRKIVNEISDKFIDLGLDEQHSDFGQDLMIKQEKFKREFEKHPFQFDAHCLQMPKGTSTEDDADTLLETEDQQVSSHFSKLGSDIHEILDIVNAKTKQMFHIEGGIIEHDL